MNSHIGFSFGSRDLATYTSLCVVSIMVCLLLITNCEIPRAYGLFDLTPSNEFKVNNFLTFRDSTLGFEIIYPEGWTHEMHPGGIVTFPGASEGGPAFNKDYFTRSNNSSTNEKLDPKTP